MSSMRDDFEDAFKQFEDGDNEAEVANEPETTAEEPVLQADDSTDTPDTVENTETTQEPAVSEAASAEKTEEPEETKQESLNAPISWGASAREHWKEVPDSVKQQVLKRENQIATALESGKENRKVGERFMDVVNKFHPIIAAEGVTDPVQGFHGLMETMAGLRMGTPHQKAALIAKFIHGYGVDINELDGILAGQQTGQPAQPTQNSQLEALLEQKMAPVTQFMNDIERQKQIKNQQLQQVTNAEVADFASKHEFYEDVRMDMADLLDLATKNGRKMSLQQAYDAACAANPEVQGALQTRNNQANLASKRNAASSISGRKAGGGSAQPESLRAALMQAWEG